MAGIQNLKYNDSINSYLIENDIALNSGNYQVLDTTREEGHRGDSEDDAVIVEVNSEIHLRVPQTGNTVEHEAQIASSFVQAAPLPGLDLIERVETSCTVSSKRKRPATTGTGEEEVDMNLTHLFSGKLLRGNSQHARRIQTSSRMAKTKPKFKQAKKSPNHFVAIQISDAEIIRKIGDVQSCVVEREPRLKSALISLPTLHITLAVMHLACDEEVERTFGALQKTCTSFKEAFLADPLHLHFEDLCHFKNKVLYGSIQHNERLYHFAQSLRDEIKSTGVELSDDGKFTPHLTVMKLSKDPRLFRKGIRQIHPRLYEEHARGRIGSQVAIGVQLLSMTDRKDANGYYASRGEFKFFTADSGAVIATIAELSET